MRFGTAAQLKAFVDGLSYKHADTANMLRALRIAMLGKRSITTTNVANVQEVFIHTMFAAVLEFGLLEWCPDVVGSSPASMYNMAHELIALKTFQQVAAAGAYSRLGPNLTHLGDMKLLVKLYRNFVYSWMGNQVKMELAEPGSVLKKALARDTYKRRKRVRLFYLADETPDFN